MFFSSGMSMLLLVISMLASGGHDDSSTSVLIPTLARRIMRLERALRWAPPLSFGAAILAQGAAVMGGRAFRNYIEFRSTNPPTYAEIRSGGGWKAEPKSNLGRNSWIHDLYERASQRGTARGHRTIDFLAFGLEKRRTRLRGRLEAALKAASTYIAEAEQPPTVIVSGNGWSPQPSGYPDNYGFGSSHTPVRVARVAPPHYISHYTHELYSPTDYYESPYSSGHSYPRYKRSASTKSQEKDGDDDKFMNIVKEDVGTFFRIVELLDENNCLHKFICNVHSRSKKLATTNELSTFESNVVAAFKILDTFMPSSDEIYKSYREAAILGAQSIKDSECSKSYSNCSYTTQDIIGFNNEIESGQIDNNESVEVQNKKMPRIRKVKKSNNNN